MTIQERGNFKIYQGVFDEYTFKTLVSLARKRYFDSIEFPISTGKEGDVYLAKKGKEMIAIKIYRVETSNFYKMQNYIIGDPRFKRVGNSKRAIVETWCQKELRNLQECMEAGVKVPYPIKAVQNILLMGYLGLPDGTPYPMLAKYKPKNPEKLVKTLDSYIRKMWKHGLVHGDLNEFNIMMKGETPIVIDVGQAMNVKHPIAKELLERDLLSVEKLARKYNVKFDLKKELEQILATNEDAFERK